MIAGRQPGVLIYQSVETCAEIYGNVERSSSKKGTIYMEWDIVTFFAVSINTKWIKILSYRRIVLIIILLK